MVVLNISAADKMVDVFYPEGLRGPGGTDGPYRS